MKPHRPRKSGTSPREKIKATSPPNTPPLPTELLKALQECEKEVIKEYAHSYAGLVYGLAHEVHLALLKEDFSFAQKLADDTHNTAIRLLEITKTLNRS